MMNPLSSSKIIVQIIRHNFYRFPQVQQIVNKSSSSYFVHQSNGDRRNQNFCSPFSRRSIHRNKQHGSIVPLYMNFQTRNLSNEAHNSVKSFIPEPTPAEVAASLTTQNLPEFVKEVSEWKIVELAQNALLQVHESTGLPWWASIVLTALTARTLVTLPLAIIQVHNTAKLQLINIEMGEAVEKLKKEANRAVSIYGFTEKIARRAYESGVKREWQTLVERDNCHPAKSYILMWVQVPMWFAFSFATRNLCYMLPKPDTSAQLTYLELTVGGFGWVPNLVDIDHYFILPVLIGITNLAVLEAHKLFRVDQTPRKYDTLRNIFFRGMCLWLMFVSTYMPVAMNCYWLSSSLFGLGQTFLIHSTRLRRIFRIPTAETELKHPYRYFYSNLKSKLRITKE